MHHHALHFWAVSFEVALFGVPAPCRGQSHSTDNPDNLETHTPPPTHPPHEGMSERPKDEGSGHTVVSKMTGPFIRHSPLIRRVRLAQAIAEKPQGNVAEIGLSGGRRILGSNFSGLSKNAGGSWGQKTCDPNGKNLHLCNENKEKLRLFSKRKSLNHTFQVHSAQRKGLVLSLMAYLLVLRCTMHTLGDQTA